jgi:cell division septal protein FtsQ
MKPIKGRQFNKKKFYLEPEKVLIIKQVLLGLFLFSAVALILTGVWYGTRLSSLTLSNIHAVDSETIQVETVKAKVEEVLVGDYWHLIPRRFSWFYPEDKILEKLQEIERIRDVKVEKMSGTELAITFSEYLPYALWCNENDDICYFIDEFGFAFGRAPELTGESLVRYHKLGEDPQLRTSFIGEEDFNKTKEFSHLLATRDWYVTEIEVDTVRDVFYSLSDGGEIRATLEADSRETFNYLVTLHQSEEFAHLAPGNFQYVDLRFGAKVYVNEESELATSTSTEDGGQEDMSKKQVVQEISNATSMVATSTSE